VLKQNLRRGVRKLGLDVRRYRTEGGYELEPFYARAGLLGDYGIEQVLDVGANVGQYGAALRRAGYLGRILSLEPLSRPFATLERRSAGDPLWSCKQLALGPTDGTVTINVAEHDAGSSVNAPVQMLVSNIPQMRIVGQEDVLSRPLDSLVGTVEGKKSMLKLDVQGYQREILESGQRLVQDIDLLEVEVSVTPLYDSEPPLLEMLEYLSEKGFRLLALDPGVSGVNFGFPLQFDAFLYRSP
jgi:FkbM family methyltransferase